MLYKFICEKNELFFALWAFTWHLWLQFSGPGKYYFHSVTSSLRGTIIISIKRSMAEDGSWTLHDHQCPAACTNTSTYTRSRHSRSNSCSQPPMLYSASRTSGAQTQHPVRNEPAVNGHCWKVWLACFFSKGREKKKQILRAYSTAASVVRWTRADGLFFPCMACLAGFPQIFFF